MCIKRHLMPQVEREDYPELFRFLSDHGVKVTHETVPSWEPQCLQCLNETRIGRPVRLLPSLKDMKPILLARHGEVIDGNHRVVIWRENGLEYFPAIRFWLPFREATDLIHHFPKVNYSP